MDSDPRYEKRVLTRKSIKNRECMCMRNDGNQCFCFFGTGGQHQHEEVTGYQRGDNWTRDYVRLGYDLVAGGDLYDRKGSVWIHIGTDELLLKCLVN